GDKQGQVAQVGHLHLKLLLMQLSFIFPCKIIFNVTSHSFI
ncbi:hypothetical protein LCGC14_1738610, partial [marine sediment metagenome]